MSPSGAAAWQLPKPSPLKRVVRVTALSLLAILAAFYLAGVLFLASFHRDLRQATPVTFIAYAHYYGDKPLVHRRLLLCAGVSCAALLVAAAAAFLPRRASLHGDARFANLREIRAAGLLGDHGILIGRIRSRCLVLPGQQGVALAAPPRAGKGTGVVVPNALHWPGSLLVIDIKRENWTLTAGFRESAGQHCYLFDPFSPDTARWNPFTYVSPDPQRRVNDLQRIAEMLYPDPPNVDPFWTASARSLFLGIALYLFETPTLPKTIGEVLRQGMASDSEGFQHHWKRIVEGRNRGPYPLSPQCVRALYDLIDLAPVTASSIRKTFTSRLDLWANPILDAATQASDFDLRQLRSSPMSIYVSVNPDDLHRLRPILSLFFQQALGLQTRELPEQNPALKYQLMVLLDEFTALGRIPIFAEAISYLPGYNVRVVLVIQTPAQLRDVYGPDAAQTMLKSLAARIAFTPKDFIDAREISDELGFTTVKVRAISQPLMQLDQNRGGRGRSVNISQQRRALRLPQEIKEMGTEEALIFYEGLRPIRCRKIRYYADRRFRARLLPPPTRPAPQRAADPSQSTEGQGSDPYIVNAPAAAATHTGAHTQDPPMTTREATLEDIDRIDQLTLEDFAADFSNVPFPQDDPGPITDTEMATLANAFIDSLRAP